MNRSLLNTRGRRLEPFQVEGVVLITADDMDNAIVSLAAGHVSAGFGIAGIHDEWASVHSLHFPSGAIVGDKADAGPGLSLVER